MSDLIYNDYSNAKKVLSSIESELNCCDEFIFSLAFISESGIACLLQSLKELEEKNIKGKIVTSNYLFFNTPKALNKLASFKNIELKIFDSSSGTGFHTKAYIFRKSDTYSVIVGSSNLTAAALTCNKEWNTYTLCNKNGLNTDFLNSVLTNFSSLWEASLPYAQYSSIYEKEYKKHHDKTFLVENIEEKDSPQIKANTMQQDFLKRFKALHETGKKALLISATGTGKTYAAALAMKEIKAKKVLFIVHREQIAKKSLESFRKIFSDNTSMALLSGNNKNFDSDFIFSTIQTLSKDEILKNFSPDFFNEIIIDEVHKAGAGSYLKVINYFKPDFLLGMSASPDRTDSFNIYELFDHNIVYEIRLKDALNQNLLCPFHYFAISDLRINGEEIDDLSSFSKLTCDERVSHIIDKLEYYSYSGTRVKGLIFCSSNDEAKVLSQKFNLLNYNTLALSGENSISEREEALYRLTCDDAANTNKLDYIFTVDIFNEGIDILCLNQVIMLRPTQSSIIFIQQLGRGLRKHKDKEFLIVIDFIANYKNNFLIPKALSSDKNNDKDSMRYFLTQATKSLPGSSTISFDKISKDKIYTAIDSAKLNNILELVKSYTDLKNKLGKIPDYKEFDEFSDVDFSVLFMCSGSYPHFLSLKESLYTNKFSSEQFEVFQFISQNLILSKKSEELLILKLLCKYFSSGSYIIDFDSFFNKLSELLLLKYNRVFTKAAFDISFRILTNKYVTSSISAKKYKNCIFFDIKDDCVCITEAFLNLLDCEAFFTELNDLLDYGLFRYDKRYANNLYKDTLFVLYEKYTYQDICKLFSWKINYVPLAIGGYKYDADTKTLPVFINYDIDENSFNKDYVHGFLSHDEFTSMSKPGRKLDSKEISYFYDSQTRIYLFMRKNKNDKSCANEFYFLGEMKTFKDPVLVRRIQSKDSVVSFNFKLLTPLRDDLYDYFTRDKI